MQPNKPTLLQSFRFTQDDDEMITQIQKEFGLTTKIAAIRYSLNAMIKIMNKSAKKV